MGFIFSLISMLFLLTILAGVVIFIVFMARKIGILNIPVDSEGKPLSSTKDLMSQLMSKTDSLAFRFGIIAILVAIMTIPLGMVSDIVNERSRLYSSVVNEIANTWGHQQTISGPALIIPYTEKFITEKVLTDKDGNERKIDKTNYVQRTAIVLPESLSIKGDLKGEQRQRSIYKSLVYYADVSLKGHFSRPKIEGLSSHIDKIHWDQAWFSLGISDTRAINKVSALQWNAVKTDFEPGTRIVHIIKNGFHAPLTINEISNKYEFNLKLNIKGSQGFYFKPFGKTTHVELSSDWPHPSFQGNVLPDEHSITKNGFHANWSIPHLARNYPQLWTLETQKFDTNEFKAGVSLFESVSLYSQITRAIKYGILFFLLTYITFLIFELGIKRRLHIVQYGMIGLALSMFYLTLLSVAEHANFFTAYLSAAALIITMITLYAFAAIRSIGATALIALLLIGLYSILYSLLNLEDYALLVGTILLLSILAVMMYLTRNIGRD
ncbi:MAG: cell envelope integrity protein CreD [Cocleimonas sp.]|nr:cell envelope integrity protein CreD [Cocleimonas sp.]